MAHNQAADVSILLDKQAITEMLYRYCYAMDANDRQPGCEVWHVDGTAHFEGMFEGLGRDFVDFGQSGHEAAFGQTSHQLTNVLVDVAGDQATSSEQRDRRGPIADSESIYVIRGRYHDKWSRARRRLANRQPTLHHRPPGRCSRPDHEVLQVQESPRGQMADVPTSRRGKA